MEKRKMKPERTVKKNISILPSLWEKASRLSKKIFDRPNASGMINILIEEAEE